MRTPSSVQELVRLSNRVGADPAWVLAGGGNTSVKAGNVLYVKASGRPLASITPDGFVRMDLGRVKGLFAAAVPKEPRAREAAVLKGLLSARMAGEEDKRPSVETLLHALIPFRFVVHAHPALGNGLTCAKDGEKAAMRLFGPDAAWVPYTDPGFTLALAVRKSLAGRKPARILFLGNHGVCVAGDSVREIERTSRGLISRVRRAVRRFPDFTEAEADEERAALLAPAVRMACRGEKCGIAAFACNREIMRYVSSAKSFARVAAPFTPDHAVYCGPGMLFIPAIKNIENQRQGILRSVRAFRSEYRDAPRVVAVEKLGIFVRGPDKKQAKTALSLFMDSLAVAAAAESFGGVRSLSKPQIRHICGWEAESYRKRVAFGLSGARRLDGKVAVVTGAAQGFGRGLAEALCREGAHVVVADRNYPLAQKTVAGLEGASEGRAAALAVDVADSESVRRLVRDTALVYGGVDILVSNAGVLRSGSLESFPESDFDLVTRVNYTGYYFCVKHVSALMKLQHGAAPGHAMDIIQINSKSGLSGSRANFAYAGGKFGGIGLTQSFALELVDFNIKVNAICPGNLFDGPLWSDPEEGLFVQYLRAKKVPGAKTVADVRRFYEAKVPMKRGCAVEDVARALLYVIDQKYETGQAIPVTGGQCMLS